MKIQQNDNQTINDTCAFLHPSAILRFHTRRTSNHLFFSYPPGTVVICPAIDALSFVLLTHAINNVRAGHA